MKIRYPYLTDISFLQNLTSYPIKDYFAKITLLSWEREDPIRDIQGKIISLSGNIDGQSSVRRGFSLSIFLNKNNIDLTDTNNQISINKKIALQVGFKNPTSQYIQYKNLWFPQGVYIVASASISHSIDSLIVSVQLKDKMSLLNGDCGGTFLAATVLDNYETVDENGGYVILRPPIYQIIKQVVNHFGGERLERIIVSDLDNRVKQVMKWTGSSPLFFVRNGKQFKMTIDEAQYQEWKETVEEDGSTWVDVQGTPFEYGCDVGYIYTVFSFPGDLIASPGDTVVGILDRIKQVLGNYEYFYNVDGEFVFQQVKNYLNNSQTKYILDSLRNAKFLPDYIGNKAYLLDSKKGKSVFTFKDSRFITSYNNSPQYSSIKNDFIVWGIRTSAQGYDFPIRYHLVIDKKPKVGNTYKVFEYLDEEDGLLKWHAPAVYKDKAHFPKNGVKGVFYQDQKTGKIYKWTIVTGQKEDKNIYTQVQAQLEEIQTKDWRTQLYLQGVAAEPYGTASNYYYTELANEWPKIYDIREGHLKDQVIKNPSQIDYYLDFIDSPYFESLSVENIGRRTKVLDQGKNVNCIFEPWIPDIILISILSEQTLRNSQYAGTEVMRKECQDRGQDYFQVDSSIYEMLDMGGVLYSGYEEVRQLLHEYTSYNESISLTTLPIFFLQPNTRISVNDYESGIYGDYLINTMSFSLGGENTLTINASRALERI